MPTLCSNEIGHPPTGNMSQDEKYASLVDRNRIVIWLFRWIAWFSVETIWMTPDGFVCHQFLTPIWTHCVLCTNGLIKDQCQNISMDIVNVRQHVLKILWPLLTATYFIETFVLVVKSGHAIKKHTTKFLFKRQYVWDFATKSNIIKIKWIYQCFSCQYGQPIFNRWIGPIQLPIKVWNFPLIAATIS